MRTYAMMAITLLLLPMVVAHGDEDFSAAEALIEQKVPCENLSNEQLELIGDYYMEQIHPGEAHERMDAMMGGEGSESLEQMHINMALSFYCGQHEALTPAMMGNVTYGGMMGPGMMGPGMMYSTSYKRGWSPLSQLVYIALAALIVAVIFWGTYNLMVKK